MGAQSAAFGVSRGRTKLARLKTQCVFVRSHPGAYDPDLRHICFALAKHDVRVARKNPSMIHAAAR
jgi:hypothetical protein